MSAPKKLDGNTETQVVAMLARGDTHQQISDWLKTEKGIDYTPAAVGVLKKRNEEGISFMKGELLKHETTMAATILDKSRRLLNTRLDKALSLEDTLKVLRKKYDDGEITDKEYYHDIDIELRSRLTVQELTQLSKESFNQSQIEQNKPTSIIDSPELAKQHLQTLLVAIANKDDAALLKGLFPDG